MSTPTRLKRLWQWSIAVGIFAGLGVRSGEASGGAPGAVPTVLVGVAKLEITPELPIRLSGYQNRPTETSRVVTPLYARAMAIGSDAEKPAILITVELIGIGNDTTEFVARALREKHGIERARLAISAVHTHTGPALADVLPFMFSRDLPADETARIEAYTAMLRRKLVQVAEAALADRKPARLGWGQGATDFAVQRRTIVDGIWKGIGVVPDGTTDPTVPVLRAVGDDGKVRAVFTNYACHCTTLSGGDNYIHSDWAGDAANRIEVANPGAVTLVALGCGADANPNPRGAAAVASHGEKLATEVTRVMAGPLRALGGVTAATSRTIELALDHAVTRAELEERRAPGAKQPATYAASRFLQQLGSGPELRATVAYPVRVWSFGNELTMVFLAGEVVADYALRLRRELDESRVWVNAYSNSIPCYIASRRMFSEGGYEVDSSMDYYGVPTRLAIGTEDQIIGTVRDLVPETFKHKERL